MKMRILLLLLVVAMLFIAIAPVMAAQGEDQPGWAKPNPGPGTRPSPPGWSQNNPGNGGSAGPGQKGP